MIPISARAPVLGRVIGPFLIGLFVSSLAWAQAPGVARSPAEKLSGSRVVVLHSYHHGLTWSDNISAGIRSVLENQPDKMELRFEFMDTRYIHTDQYFAQLRDLLRVKYLSLRTDVVICSDDHALNFMLTQGDDVFPEVPVVFCSVSGYEPGMRKQRELTGLLEEIDIRATMEVALDLHPEAKEVAVITDMTRTGRALKAKAKEAFREFEPRVDFRYLEDLTVDELEREISEITRETIVFLFFFRQDRGGRVLSHEEKLQRLVARCSVPIYAVWEFYLGHGIVGGKLTSGAEEGKAVAELALRILGGERASDIPLGTSPSRYWFDWQQMQRFGIKMADLPEGSLVINRPFSLYETYRVMIWSVVAAFVVLVFLVSFLAANIVLRRRAERELRESEVRFRSTFEHAAVGIAHVAPDGRFLRINPRFCEIVGFKRDEMLARSLQDITHPDDRDSDMDLIDRMIGRKIPTYSIEKRYFRKDGSLVWANLTMALVREPWGDPKYFISVIEDITQRRRAEEEKVRLEEQLRQAQKLEAIGQLAGGVAHDFNNMLAAIQGNAELLRGGFEPGSDETGLLEQIINASERASDLTSQLLAFARKGTLRNVPVDVHQTIREVYELLSRGIDKCIEIVLDLRADRSVVSGDSSQLQSALLNLGLNARDAMNEGGRMSFTTRNVELDETSRMEHHLEVEAGEYLEISVTDTGVGMDSQLQERIFEPFFTTKEQGEGTGLGLAGVYGCVKSHQGSIEVFSEPGRGTTFTVLLPIAGATRRASDRPAGETVKGTGHILIVNDEEIIRNFAALAVSGLGYTVSVCADGAEAVTHYKEHYREIDLVILDLIMPKLSGADVFRELKGINPNVKVLISSGYGHKELAEDLAREGVVGFLSKPFRISKLSEEIARHIKAGSYSAG